MGEDGFCEFTRIDPKATIHWNNGSCLYFTCWATGSGYTDEHSYRSRWCC